jgi:predicted  nucleic acid-binding Zn-ribbon protein
MTNNSQNPEEGSLALKYQLDQLVKLQEIDLEIHEGDQGLARIPGQLKAAQSGMEEKTQKKNTAIQEIQNLQNDRKQLELDVQGETDHMAKAKMKLPAVKTNKEYTAILHEIDAIKEKISSFEDRELEIMEVLEEKEKVIPAIESEFKEEEKKYQEYKTKKETEAVRVKKELEDLKAQRQEVVRSLDPEWVRNYDRVAKGRDGLAVVSIKEGVCQGCFQGLRPQVIIDIKTSEKMHHCPECSRFLYWKEEATPENETAMPK